MDTLIPVDDLIERLEQDLIPQYQREGLTMQEEVAHKMLEEYKDIITSGHNYLIISN